MELSCPRHKPWFLYLLPSLVSHACELVRGPRDRLILEQQFTSSPRVPNSRLDSSNNVVVRLCHVRFCTVAVVEDVGEALKFPIASTAFLVFHLRFTADREEVESRMVDESPVHESSEGSVADEVGTGFGFGGKLHRSPLAR